MLNLILGADWVANRNVVHTRISNDVINRRENRVLIVPELTSYDSERRLCEIAGDTLSRYAEVLTFTRLASRVADAAGNGAMSCMDNGGRVVAMAYAARQLHSKLKAYASVETKPEFLSSLVDAVDEFKRCCITGEDLMFASKNTTGSLAQKLEELSLLLETYDLLCEKGKRDPRDQMTWLLDQLEVSDFAQSHIFYIDGFPDFTRQHFAILEHLIRSSPEVTISLTCDRPGSDGLGFEVAGKTAADLIACAKKNGVPVNIDRIPMEHAALTDVKSRLLQGSADNISLPDKLTVYQTGSVYQECVAAAQHIIELVNNGARYRDICVVSADMEAYRHILQMTFHRCEIPVYLSGTDDILEKSAVSAVLAAMEAALGGLEQKDVLRYLRSVFSPLRPEEYDRLENYAIIWNINGKQWLADWQHHPEGLSGKWSENAYQSLSSINGTRMIGVEPLRKLKESFDGAKTLRDQILGLYAFFEDITLSERLDALANTYERKGDSTSAQILNQLWEILILALEQMYDVLGNTVWDSDTFTRLFRLLLSQYDVGTIPMMLDSVTVGSVKALRCQECKHLLVLGALEGSLPSYGAAASVLSDQERSQLRDLGLPLLGGSLNMLQTEFSEIYAVFCGAQETITVSCPAGQPSFVYRRLRDMAGKESPPAHYLGAALTDKLEAGAYLARYSAESTADDLHLLEQYHAVQSKTNHSLGSISQENVRMLYGQQLNLSASQIDSFADCRLSYFLKYGLRAKERKQASIDPAEFGTYIHSVLENTVKSIMELGGFKVVSLEQALEIANNFSKEYAQAHFSELDTNRLSYLFSRNAQELSMLVNELWHELRQSAFTPVDFELGFGDGEKLAAITVSGRNIDAKLRGFVDRIDVWQAEDKNYFRVVDYKTGKKDFDYCDVFNGLGLQMLLYLFVLQAEGESIIGTHPIPAGVQYFPARAPLIAANGLLSPEEADAAREKLWKRKGILLSDDDILWAMEPSETPKRLPVTVKKDGTKSGDLATREQFALLKDYIFKILSQMIDEIGSGCIEANPYTRGSRHNPCVYCPYTAICHPQDIEGRRNFAAMSAQRFWDEIGKELSTNG